MLVFLLLLVGVIVYFNGQLSPYEKYVYQQSYSQYSTLGNQYRIVVVADMDTDSRVKGEDPAVLKFRSVLKQGELLRSKDGTYSVSWKDEVRLDGDLLNSSERTHRQVQ